MANFDKIKSRKNTNCVKYDGAYRYFGTDIEHPLWVADMDFEVPKFLRKRLHKKVDFGIFGYEEISKEFYKSIIFWQKLQNNIILKKHNIVYSSSVVASLGACVRAFSDIGDEVVVFSPVYYPFFSVIEENQRRVLNQELVLDNGKYSIDFDKLKQSITPKTKLILFCSPHNPIGKIWSEKELTKLANIAIENNLFIVSDEIHCDIVFDKFISMAKDERLKNRLIVLNSPSKTFNTAGLASSYAFCYDIDMLRAFKAQLASMHSNHLNSFSNVAMSVYSYKGKVWLIELLKYIQSNKTYVIEFLKFHKSKIKVIDSNATYLLWLDFREFGLSQKELKQKLYDAKIGLNSGDSFGLGGVGFMRLNIATQNKNLIKVLEKLIKVF
jgi:cysteine-S-conjugate beta-lyase